MVLTIESSEQGASRLAALAGSASSEVAIVCCLGSLSRDRLMPNEDCLNQGMEIFLRDLPGFFWVGVELPEPPGVDDPPEGPPDGLPGGGLPAMPCTGEDISI